MNNETWFDYSKYFNDESIVAGFTNIFFPFNNPEDRIEFAKIINLNSKKIVKPKQIHSNKVNIVDVPGEILNLDGIITNLFDLVLSVQVADCIPIFIYDKSNNIIGLVHAGWRGVHKGIIENSIDKLNQLDSELMDVIILLGPSIRQCCFEIGPEVAELFDSKFQIEGESDRTYLDLQAVVKEKLLGKGVKHNQIFDVKNCTCCSDNYHSYRRDGKKAGRMIAMIGYKK
jgi:YfiH family protein